MAKPMFMVALFLALLASANAATVRTIITTEEEVKPGQQTDQQCSEQMQAMQLRECTMYISRGSPCALRMVINPQGPMLHQCCMKLENVPEQCRCRVINKMMTIMEPQWMGQQGEQQMGQMMQKAQYLPKMCIMPPHVCQF